MCFHPVPWMYDPWPSFEFCWEPTSCTIYIVACRWANLIWPGRFPVLVFFGRDIVLVSALVFFLTHSFVCAYANGQLYKSHTPFVVYMIQQVY